LHRRGAEYAEDLGPGLEHETRDSERGTISLSVNSVSQW